MEFKLWILYFSDSDWLACATLPEAMFEAGVRRWEDPKLKPYICLRAVVLTHV